ncbi:MAG: hypothetical protein IPL46_12015 [Saprospiraceae bacterium]|nr:hypothetical protein [Saprospiraceae bacterium]
MDKINYLRPSLVGHLTILSGVIALISYFQVAAGFNFHFELFSNPALIFETAGINTSLLKWSMITDIFGYYLLLLPLVIYMHLWMKDSFAWSPVINLSGIGYILIGSVGAAVLAVIWPMHIDQFASLTGQQQEISRMIFISITNIVVEGLWNLLDSILIAVWFLGIAIFLRSRYKAIANFTFTLSAVCFLDFLGNALAIKPLAEITVNIYLVLAPIWAIVMGFKIKYQRSDV